MKVQSYTYTLFPLFITLLTQGKPITQYTRNGFADDMFQLTDKPNEDLSGSTVYIVGVGERGPKFDSQWE